MKLSLYRLLGFLAVFLSIFSLLSLPTAFAQTTFSSFSINLSYGDALSDVQQLQRVLNINPSTQVALSGPGSPGQETDFFGKATLAAVIKFQNLYAADILYPAGLKTGNGFVGPLTRKKLNSLLPLSSSPSPGQGISIIQEPISSRSPESSAQGSSSSSGNVPGALILYQVTPFEVEPGSQITLTGNNLNVPGLIVNIGSYSFSGSALTFSNQDQLTIQLPASIPLGTYTASIATSSTPLKSRYNTTAEFTVTPNPMPAPQISGITPSDVASINDPVTVTGTNLTGSLSVYSPFGVIQGLSSSNGTDFTFSLSQFSQISKISNIPEGDGSQGLEIYIAVLNNNGYSNAGNFILKY